MHWKELEVWKKAHKLVLEIYKLTSSFPSAERYGLIEQLGRASYSVPANINDNTYQKVEAEYTSVSKMLSGLIKSLKT